MGAPGGVAPVFTQDGNQQAAQCLQLPLQQLLQYDMQQQQKAPTNALYQQQPQQYSMQNMQNMQQAPLGQVAQPQQEPQMYSWQQQQPVNQEVDMPPYVTTLQPMLPAGNSSIPGDFPSIPAGPPGKPPRRSARNGGGGNNVASQGGKGRGNRS